MVGVAQGIAPVTVLPVLCANNGPPTKEVEMISYTQPEAVDWSAVLHDIKDLCPQMSKRRISELTGVSMSTLTGLRTGRRTQPWHSTGMRILALRQALESADD